MGQALSFGLTQNDVDELKAEVDYKFSQAEIEALYQRFRTLDKQHKGLLTKDELLSIPELSINPLNERLASMFGDWGSFTEFVTLLSKMSPRATDEDRLQLIFKVIDQDQDGLISVDDLVRMLSKLLAAGTFTDAEMRTIVQMAMEEEGIDPDRGVSQEQMTGIFAGHKFRHMKLEVPTEY